MDDRHPTGWLENVTLEGSSEPVRVVLHERQGSKVVLRQVDPEEPEPERVPLYEGDQVVVMTALSHIGIHTQETWKDNSDLVHSMRIVPVRREGNTVYARTLRHGEVDDERRVHVMPDDQVTFEGGEIVADLEAIDAREQLTESGHKPIATVLSAWFSIGREHWDDSAVRYILAAARRLDMANELFIRVRQAEEDINAGPPPGPELRRKRFTVIGSVELGIISLGRAMTMIENAPKHLALTQPSKIPSAMHFPP